MLTSDFEVPFTKRLSRHLNDDYPALKLIVPGADFQKDFVPDLVVQNPYTFELLAIEVKGGTSSNSVPSAVIGKLGAINSSWEQQGKTQVCLVTSACVPESLREILTEEGIEVIEVDSLEEAVRELNVLPQGIMHTSQAKTPINTLPS